MHVPPPYRGVTTVWLTSSFAAFLADQGLAPQTGKTYMYLAAVRSMQISLGLPDPRDQSSLPILKRVQAGISRARLLKASPPRVRLPITAQLLSKIKSALEGSSHPEKLALWAVSLARPFLASSIRRAVARLARQV